MSILYDNARTHPLPPPVFRHYTFRHAAAKSLEHTQTQRHILSFRPSFDNTPHPAHTYHGQRAAPLFPSPLYQCLRLVSLSTTQYYPPLIFNTGLQHNTNRVLFLGKWLALSHSTALSTRTTATGDYGKPHIFLSISWGVMFSLFLSNIYTQSVLTCASAKSLIFVLVTIHR